MRRTDSDSCSSSYLMVMSHLLQQQQLFMKQLGVTVILNGHPQPFLRNTKNSSNISSAIVTVTANPFCATEQTINDHIILVATFVLVVVVLH